MNKSTTKPANLEASVLPITFKSGSLTLEGRLSLLSNPGQPGLVICHPHPLLGGTMDDSRVRAIFDTSNSHGFNALCFNFRGTGNSQGSFGKGIGEVQDTISAVNFLRGQSKVDGSRIALCGYSFGGSVALAAALNANPAALVTLSASLHVSDTDSSFITDTLRYIRCPTYVLHGLDDDVVPSTEAEVIFTQLQMQEKYIRLIKGANHYWTSRFNHILPMIFSFLTEKLKLTKSG
ncbi:MAG: alpha/beta hydrolase [Promethearchaeota archaeon]